MRARLRSLLFVALSLSAAADSFTLGGSTYELTPRQVDGRTVFGLDDPATQSLIAATSARLQPSGSGQTLYVYLPGRETSWSDHATSYRQDGADRPAPGCYFGSARAMEPSALWTALGLRAYPQAGSATRLQPEVTRVLQVGGDVQVLSAAPLKWLVSEPEQGVLRVQLRDAAWGGGARQQTLGEADISVSGGDAVDAPVTLDVRVPSFWAARARQGLTRELLLSVEPRHGLEVGEEGVLEAVAEEPRMLTRDAASSREVRFDLSRPAPFFWAFYPKQHALRVEFPGVRSAVTGSRVLSTSRYQVTRYEVKLADSENFEFFQKPDLPNALFLRLGPPALVKGAEPLGSAIMAGGMGGGKGDITLDPGHGGGDPGCRNRSLDVYEKDVTLDICQRLQKLLEAQGWTVHMTRTSDRDVTYAGSPDLMELKARADVANNAGSDVFVSIHCNASVSSAVRGTAIYWYKAEDRELAEDLDVLADLGFEEDGLIQNSFAVLRLTGMPAVLVETAFLTHPGEGRLLASPEVRQGIAERLARGLGAYMAKHEKKRT